MSRIVWDKLNQRRFELGVSNGVLFVGNDPGVPWNGLTAVTEGSSGGEPVELWADNIKYAVFRSIEIFEGTIEAYLYPEEFSKCDGSYSAMAGVYFDNQKRESFSFCYQTKIQNGTNGDGYKLHLLYNLMANPTEKGYSSLSDSPDTITFSWDITSIPTKFEGWKPTSTITIDSTKVPAARLKQLEDILYGADGTDPRMPAPEEVIEIIEHLDLREVFLEVLSIPKHWIWDTFNFRTSNVPDAIKQEADRHVFENPDTETEYIQPSIAYWMSEEDPDENRTYFIDVIDEKMPSAFLEAVRSRISMEFLGEETKGSFVYYHHKAIVY